MTDSLQIKADIIPYAPTYSALVRTWLNSEKVLLDVCRSNEFPPPEDLVDSWQRSDVIAYLLSAKGEPVAYGELWPRPAEFAVEIAHLLVDPKRRSHGYGTRLLELLFSRLTGRPGVNKAIINLYSDNERALGCYLKAGFELLGTTKHIVGLRMIRLVR
ncbi:MAG: GNAT family N-acetyltransferase [candidate division Zixibacteria bacterium]|nr:GNAT family N-acetyltransferase [candidate division Zixibacteria bacterium]